MADKPSYKGLKQRVKDLEKQALEHRRTTEALQLREMALRAILNASPVAVGFAQNRILNWHNKALYRIVGYEEGSLFGQNARILYPDDKEYERAGREIYSGVTEGGFGETETRWITKDGKIVNCHLRASLLDPSDPDKGVIVVAEDITERKHVEDALRESEERYRLLFNSGNDAVFVHQPTAKGLPGRFIEVNEIACQRYGYTREEFCNLTPLDLSAPENVVDVPNRVRRLFTNEHVIFETLQITKDGRKIPVEISSHLFELSGQPTVLSIARDITERKLAEAALRESEEKYRTVVENANEGIIVTQDEMVNFVNHQVIHISGYSEEELTSRPFLDFVHPDDRRMVLERHRRRLRGEKLPRVYPFRIIDKNRNIRWVQVNPIIASWEGRPATLTFLTDITERKHAEDALRESEETFRSLFSESPIGIEIYDAEGRLFNANKACLDMFGITNVAQIIDFNLFEDSNVADEVRERLERGESARYEVAFDFDKVKESSLYETKKSGIIDLDVMITPLGQSQSDTLSGYLVQVQDISERKQAEKHIRTLTQQLIRAQENERRMISRELHDRVAQDLSTIKMGLETLFHSHPKVSPEMGQRVSDLSGILRETISAIRDLAYDLRPPSLDRLGLVQSIYQYCNDFSEKTGLRLDFTSAGMDDLELDFDTEINLYRIVQEGLMNVRKHAEATHVVLRLVASFPHIILRIVDDGKGFDVEKRLASFTNEKRMGLRSIEERVSLLGGKMSIKSSQGKGTSIVIEVPYKEKGREQ